MGIKSTILLTPSLANAQINRISVSVNNEMVATKKELKSLPKGKLYIRYRDNHIQFNKRTNGHVQGITNFPETVHALARRQFLELSINLFEQILEDGWTRETERIIEKVYPKIEALLKKFDDAGLDIGTIVMTPNQRIWNSDRYSQKNSRREDLIYPTKGGIYMRSKSEQKIGDLLELLHIPYRYETELVINNRAYHPDFIIMLPNGRLVILEHVGRMDSREYDEDLVTRLQAYNIIGLMIGRDIFFTFESDTREDSRVKEALFQILTANPNQNTIMSSLARKAGCDANC